MRPSAAMSLQPAGTMLPLAALAASATASQWCGPTALIWNDASCPLLGSAGNGSQAKIADCEAACLKIPHCNAINFNTGHGTGDRCQLRRCDKPVPPTWNVVDWRGYATFPVTPVPPAPPPMKLVLLKKQQLAATGAACLDGSAPGFYWEAGTGADANKWVVFLNGGGWCYTLAPSPADPFGIPGGPKATGWGNADSCWGRSRSGLGSTLPVYNPPTAKGGWLANTPMANWSKASVIYCDGTSFGGNRDEPVVAAGTGSPVAEQNRTLYFRGQRNLDAVLDELKSRGMASAEMAVLGGCSAGGLGALVQCDHFAAALPGVKNKRCIGDAGVFIDATSLTSFPPGKQSVMQKQFGNVVAMSNASLPPACLTGPRNTFPGACFFPENVLPTQTTPTFVRNSFYNYGDWEVLPSDWHNSHNFTPGLGWRNSYAVGNGTCIWEQGRSSNSTADGCSAANHATMRRFQQEFSAAVAPAMAPTSKHGAFIDNCATCHCQGMWNSRVIDGVRESDALEGWLLHGQPAKFEAKPIL